MAAKHSDQSKQTNYKSGAQRDQILKRMLEMPHKPHQTKARKTAKKKATKKNVDRIC